MKQTTNRQTLNGGEYVYRTVEQAREALSARYADQTLRFPSMRAAVSESTYVAVNLKAARRYFDPDATIPAFRTVTEDEIDNALEVIR